MEQSVTSSLAEPEPTDSRIPHLDMLRGFAMFGVLLVNLFEERVDPVAHGSLIQQLNWSLADGKFYPLLTLLFGIGFTLQMTRLMARGAPAALIYARRAVTLVAIGFVAHVALMANTVLLQYGTLAFALLLLRKMSTRGVLVVVSVLALLSILQAPYTMYGRFGLTGPPREAPRAATSPAAVNPDAVMRHGSYPEIVALRASSISRQITGGTFFLSGLLFQRFALILLGLIIARMGILAGPVLDRRILRRTLWCGLAIGLIGQGLLLIPGLFGPRDFTIRFYGGQVAKQALRMLSTPPLAFAYGAGLLLLSDQSAKWQARFAPLTFVGRTALSNFLLQYAFILLMFWLQRWGVIGNTSAGLAVVLTIVVFAVELRLSRWWLAHCRFGPAEWLWRSATYASWQSMSLTSTSTQGC